MNPLIIVGHLVVTSFLFVISLALLFFIFRVLKEKESLESRFIAGLGYLLSGYLLSLPSLIFVPLILLGLPQANLSNAFAYLLIAPLSILVPLIIYASTQDAFVKFHSLQNLSLLVLLFSISSPLILIATYITIITLGYGVILAVFFLFLNWVFYIVVIFSEILLGWKAFKGEWKKIYLIGDLCQRFTRG